MALAPIVTNRRSSASSSSTVTQHSSAKTVAASAKSIPCFQTFAVALLGFHSYPSIVCTLVHSVKGVTAIRFRGGETPRPGIHNPSLKTGTSLSYEFNCQTAKLSIEAKLTQRT